MATIRRKKGIEPLGPGLAHGQMRFAATLDAAPTGDWCNAFTASSLRFSSGPRDGAADFFISGDQVTFETTAGQVRKWVEALDALIEDANKETTERAAAQQLETKRRTEKKDRLRQKFKNL
jgi:hypothetical protein